MKPLLRFNFLVALTLLIISGLAFAQDPSGDPPTRVMRLQQMDGAVSLQPGGVDDWVAANLNRPLTTADRVWTDVDSRAELTMASAALRMGSETSVTLTNLDDNTAQIELDQGTLNLSVRYLNPGEIVEVDTPNFAYTVFKPGEYRFEVLPDQDTSWITVRRGDGEASGQGGTLRIRGGQQYSFSQGQSLNYMRAASRPNDAFDEWCEMRERRETSSASAQYVAAGTVGYEDLDDNGAWVPSAAYGTVWYPRVHEGWAPYREGHWAWVEPWGWTWVDDAPWGFAPFHYGRWVNDGGRWGWIPGPVGVRPVYAPALVAWVGGASFGVSIGVGGGGVGWFPLGWHDPYLPSYHVSPAYARNVNISNSRVVNVTVINNYYSTTNVNIRNTTINNVRYENSQVRGAVTGVSSSTFASGKLVRGNSVVVPASAVGRSGVMTSAAVVPTKEAVLGGRPPSAMPQHIVAPRQVASKVAPPPRPVTFEQQRPLLEKSNGVPLAPAVRANIRASSPPPPARGGQPPANQQGGRPPKTTQPAPTQQKPPVANQPGTFNQGGRPPVRNVPAPPPQSVPPANANQAPANTHGQVPGARPAETPNRTPTPPPPTRETAPVQPPRNAPPAREAAPPQPPRNAPPALEAAPPQPPRNAPPAPEAAPPQPPRNAPPAREAAPPQPPRNAPPAREAAPPQPPRNAPPARGAAPPQPPRNAPPAREAAPPQPPRNAPPAREAAPPQPPRNAPPPAAAPAQGHKAPPPAKEKEKEKEKESK